MCESRSRGSSPKLLLWNNALVSALGFRTHKEAVADGAWWGRLVENAVGAHLLNGLPAADFGVTYWREGDREVDFVVTRGAQVWAIEVKSGRPGRLSGVEAFKQRYPKARVWLVEGGGVSLEEFFLRPATDWFT